MQPLHSLWSKYGSLTCWVVFGLTAIIAAQLSMNALLDTNRAFLETEHTVTEPIIRHAAVLPDTSSWKTYRNERYGFEVRYPANWYTDPVDNMLGIFGQADFDIKFWQQEKDYRQWQGNFTISIYQVPQIVDVKKWILNSGPKTPTRESLIGVVGDTSLSGANATEAESFNFDSRSKIIITKKGGYIYAISFDKENPNDPKFIEHYGIYNQIPSTFRFIEPAVGSPTNWKEKVRACIDGSFLESLLPQVEKSEINRSKPLESVQELVETWRGCVTLPEGLYPRSKRKLISKGDAALGYVSNWEESCGGTMVGPIKGNCTGDGYEAVGNGEVLFEAKSAISGIPDINMRFLIHP